MLFELLQKATLTTYKSYLTQMLQSPVYLLPLVCLVQDALLTLSQVFQNKYPQIKLTHFMKRIRQAFEFMQGSRSLDG